MGTFKNGCFTDLVASDESICLHDGCISVVGCCLMLCAHVQTADVGTYEVCLIVCMFVCIRIRVCMRVHVRMRPCV